MRIITFILFILVSFSLSAKKMDLICKDIELAGFEGEDNYSKFKLYRKTTFEIELDLDNKIIVSDDLTYISPVCDVMLNVEGYDDFIYCNQFGYSFNLNLNNLKFTRTRGFGYVMANNDDIGIGYGTCKIHKN